MVSIEQYSREGMISNTVCIEKRQRGPFGLTSLMPSKQKAFKIESISPITKVEGAKRIKIIYGPYKLGAANVGEPICTAFDRSI
jgi:hypothetical protein